MEEREIQALLIKYAEGKCTEEEKALIESAYLLENESYTDELSKEEIATDLAQVLKELPKPNRNIQLWPKLAAAACVIIAIGIGLYTLRNSNSATKKTESFTNLISPGKNTATLTLASGKVIQLAGSKAGVVINASQFAYDDGTRIGNNNETGYQTISTPNGGQYKIVLPDGSLIMLNAATTIRFPSNFHGLPTRAIELKGEAYFEVAKDKHHPFIVTAGDQKVEVLGTHFNIASYAEQPTIKTTLLEGSVKVSSIKSGLTKQLKPGQRASFSGNAIGIEDVDVDDAVAWKNGYFMFNYETLEEVMVKISRWYDIEVQYDDASVKSTIFFGTISRFESITKVLNMLERTKKVRFQVDGRVVKVISKAK